jgi:hypothetical protein
MEALDAGRTGSAWAVRRRVLRRWVAGIVDGNRVLADDLATRVDAVSARSAHARDRKLETGVLAVLE